MRALAALALGLPLAAAAADVRSASRIEAVTVYQSSARVTRVAVADLPAGDARLLLTGLADGLADDSVRVRGSGTARARIHGVSVERLTAEASASAEVRAAEERLERLADEDRELEDQEAGARTRRDFVDSLRSTYSEERAQNLAVRGVPAREWAELTAFAAREREAAARILRRAGVARRELGRKIQAARAELAKLQAKRGQTTKTVAVELRAEKAGRFEVEVSYLVPVAGWRPVWDARLSAENGTLELSLHGSVEQRTGEDWSQVALTLSTAQPARSLFVPDLEPRYLEKPRHAKMVRELGRQDEGLAGGALRAAPAEAAGSPETKAELGAPPAALAEGILSAAFRVPRRESVDGAGRARKVLLASFPLRAEVSRLAAPRKEPAAFLTAKARNPGPASLLPGPADVFLGDEFVGRTQLPLTPPGGEVRLAFGADDRVQIERRVLERNHETAGLFAKDDVVRYRVRTSVKNLRGMPVTVRLLDLLPVSREEDVRVEVLDGTTQPTEPEDPMKPGVRAWTLTLAPGQEQAVELRYRIRFPRGTALAGLE